MKVKNIKIAGIICNPKIKGINEVIHTLSKIFNSKRKILYCEKGIIKRKIENIRFASPESVIKKSSLIFAIGGDGTILRAARLIDKSKKLLIGINMGNLGFLTELRKEDIENSVLNILNGEYEIDMRNRLKVEILEKNKTIKTFLALNDAVIQNSDIARIMEINISINKEKFADIYADGIILATPTGSTAYSLSANGPVVFPDNSVILITPICPHTLSNRPIVLNDSKVIDISTLKGKKPIVTIDGQKTFVLKKNQKVRIKKSSYPIYLVKTKDISYIQVLKEKLGWKG